MKGRTTFSKDEIQSIRELVNLKNSLPSNKQKKVRDQLRKMDFYLSDFNINQFYNKGLRQVN